MRFRSPTSSLVRMLAAALFVAHCSACGEAPHSDRSRYVPAAATARQALEKAMNGWRAAGRTERTTPTVRPVLFVEQQQPPGQRLLDFEVLGETPGYESEGYRRFLVRLTLAEPEDSVVAAYFVFGEDPLWIYRAEDFDMIMHMDMSMMAPPPAAAPPPANPAPHPEASP